MDNCELCAAPGGTLLWNSPRCRVVRIADPQQPGFCRVIWNTHVSEMTDLVAGDRIWLMQIVFCVEQTIRDLFAPDKINLASFGNMTPHLHWHVIPRWRDDPHFPQPIWGIQQRPPVVIRPEISDEQMFATLSRHLASAGVPS